MLQWSPTVLHLEALSQLHSFQQVLLEGISEQGTSIVATDGLQNGTIKEEERALRYYKATHIYCLTISKG